MNAVGRAVLRSGRVLAISSAAAWCYVWVARRMGFDLKGGGALLAASNHLDVDWYRRIVEGGYAIDPSLKGQSTVFFPLHPYQARWLHTATGWDPVACLNAVHAAWHVILCVSLVLFLETVERREPSGPRGISSEILASVALFAHPAAVFLLVPYTETLFLALVFLVCALWNHAHGGMVASAGASTTGASVRNPTEAEGAVPRSSRRIRLAAFGTLGVLLGLARPSGLFFIPLAMAAVMAAYAPRFAPPKWKEAASRILAGRPRLASWFPTRSEAGSLLAVACGAALGLALFAALLDWAVGDPLAFHRYRATGWDEAPSLRHLALAFAPRLGGHDTFRDLYLLLGLGVSVWLCLKRRFFLGTFCLAMLLPPLYQGKSGDMIRYALSIAPAWVLFYRALAARPATLACASAISAAHAVYFLVLWLQRGWVG